jgi:hypothetical protein
LKQKIILTGELQRSHAIQTIKGLPLEPVMEVEIKQHKKRRNLDQNAKLWAMLTDVASQVEWYGQKLSKDEWKCVFSASLHQQKVVPGLDTGFVVMAQSTSRMSVADFSEMIELITAFGTQHGVKWRDYGI